MNPEEYLELLYFNLDGQSCSTRSCCNIFRRPLPILEFWEGCVHEHTKGRLYIPENLTPAAAQSSGLFKLPIEILLMIMEDLAPREQICLAVTSKRMLSVSTSLKIDFTLLERTRERHELLWLLAEEKQIPPEFRGADWADYIAEDKQAPREFRAEGEGYIAEDITGWKLCWPCAKLRPRSPFFWDREHSSKDEEDGKRWAFVRDQFVDSLLRICPQHLWVMFEAEPKGFGEKYVDDIDFFVIGEKDEVDGEDDDEKNSDEENSDEDSDEEDSDDW
ncbi:hypothetical protein BJX99DRAFT_234130 [Aspergillus californicus]